MTIRSEDQEKLRLYLLGRLAEEEQRREVEERLLTDNEYFDELGATEDELIDQYLSSTLTKLEREEFENYFLSTQERRRKLSFGRTLAKYVEKEAASLNEARKPSRTRVWWQSLSTSPLGLSVVALLLLVAVGIGTWWAFFYKTDVDKGLTALRAAYQDQRPVEARISALGYAPFIETRGTEPVRVDSAARERAELLLLSAVQENPGPASRHALGQFYLTQKRFSEAIEQFDAALKADPNNAKLHSDMGAALLEAGKAESQGQPGVSSERFGRSLEELDRALELDDSLLEARFNRALCYQYLLLLNKAEAEWREYLERDPSSAWADEARRNLARLEQKKKQTSQNQDDLFREFVNAQKRGDDETAWKLLSQNRNIRGGFILNRLLDDYLDAKTQGNADAGDSLQLLLYAGQLEAHRSGDRFISALGDYYRSVSPAHLSQLIDARRELKRGHEMLDQSRVREAVEAYERARQLFLSVGNNVEAGYIEYPLGHCYNLQSNLKLSLSTFREVETVCDAAQYKWLQAQALNAIAMVEMSLNNYSAALHDSQRSLSISENIGDTNGLLKTTHQLGEVYLYLNDFHKALSLYQRDLALSTIYSPEPIQLWRTYFSIARSFYLLGFYSTAVEYQKEAVRLALEANAYPENLCRSYIHLGVMLGSLHRYDEAMQNAQRAFELAERLSDNKTRADNIAYSSLHLGNLYRQAGDNERAIESYNKAIELYEEMNNPAFKYVAHKGKLLSCIARGDDESAKQEIAITLDLFEQYRANIADESHRDTFFDGEQNIYDVITDYKYTQKGDARAAFDNSELSRARSLYDMTKGATEARGEPTESDFQHGPAVSRPISLAEIQARLPAEAQIVEYAVLDNKLLVWVVTRDDFSYTSQPISSKLLNQKVLDYLKVISTPAVNNEREAQEMAADLYDLLIKPLKLTRGKQVCIIPDKVLNYLPFGALYSRATNQYFLEEYIASFAPSSNMLIVSSEEANRRQDYNPERVLSVGDTSFDRQAFPDLADLPSARSEAESVASSYGSFPAITGHDATKSRVVNMMQSAEVVHLALHSVVDDESPSESKLLLADDSGRPMSGVLYARELYRLNLPRTRLVVLSSCRSGVERYYGGEGMIGLARPFMALHVPLVVASLWPVDSDSTRELMVSFHNHRKEGHSTAEALKLAQLDLLKQAGIYHHPYYWASFIAIGGYARF